MTTSSLFKLYVFQALKFVLTNYWMQSFKKSDVKINVMSLSGSIKNLKKKKMIFL